MKTLVLTHEYYPYRGGIARYCYNLFRFFSPKEYFVLTDQKEIDAASPIASRKVLSTFMRPSWFKGVSVVQKFVREKQSDVIFTPNILPLGSIAYSLYRSHKIPYVISLHGFDIGLALQNKRKQAIAILNAAQHIVVNSEATKKIVAQLDSATSITVITPWVEEDKLIVGAKSLEILRKKYGTKKIVLTVGRLVRRKGHDMVIRALHEVRKHVPDAHYCIVGDGPDRGYYESLIAELHLEKHVDIITNVSDVDLAAYYALASVFAMPTRQIENDVEGFGIVYLEAAYFSLPIIAGRSGGEAEALGSGANGLQIDGEDLGELTTSLINLLQDHELATFLGNNAREHVMAMPSWAAQSKTLRAILSNT